MIDKPVDLDQHRGMAAQKSTVNRRRRQKVHADQEAVRARQTEFEKHFLASPATTFSEVAVKAVYLLDLFATTPDASDPRRQRLIAKVKAELTRLSE